MKTFKNGILVLAVLFSISCFVTSCSKDDTAAAQNTKVSAYLKSFYGKNTRLGNSAESTIKIESSAAGKSEEFQDIVVTEVFVGDDARARGYVITSKDTNVFLYFADVDRDEYRLITADIEANETLTVENIDSLDRYMATNQLDFIKITEDYIHQNGQGSALGKIRYSYGACRDGFRGVYQASFFLGWQWTDWTPVQENGHNVTVGCNEKYKKDLSIN